MRFIFISMMSILLLIINSNSLYSYPPILLGNNDTINVIPYMEITENFPEVSDVSTIKNGNAENWKTAGRDDLVLYKEKGSHLWVRFHLENDTIYNKEVFIKVKEFVLDSVVCYIFYNNGKIQTYYGGIRKPLSKKEIRSVDSIFPVKLESKENAEIYIDVQADIFTAFYITLFTDNGIFEHLIKFNLLNGLYFGSVFFMGILSLAILYYMKDIAYLYYFCFLISDAIFQFSRILLSIYLIYPEYPQLNLSIWYSSHVVSFMFATLFFRIFLNLKELNQILNKISLYMAFIILLFLPLPYLFNENTFYIPLGVGFLYTVTVFMASIYAYGRGYNSAKYFFTAWSFLIAGSIASTIATKNTFIREYASMIGSVLQMIFIVFAFLSRTNEIKAEKEKITDEVSGYKRELNIAQKIQMSLLPEQPPKLNGCDIGTYYLPMKEIGGDYYDFYVKDDKSLSCLVADVAGHGPAAALIASMLKVSFGATTEYFKQPKQALLKMNSALVGNLGKKFITAVYAYIDLNNKILTYSSAGHPAILIQRRSEQRIIYMEPKGQFLGWFDDIRIREYSVPIMTGDRILLYTDGLIEAFNEKHIMFDYNHLEETLMKHTALSAVGISYLLGYRIKEWVGFTRDFEDDITIVTIDIQ